VHDDSVRDATPFLVETHHPATFLSRGVVAPFTTPRLTGSRVRVSLKGDIELVVPNPSGGRGVYILDWAGVRTLGHPTVHDSILFKRLASVDRLDPAGMRDAALDVARQGHAGKPAIAAATLHLNRDAAHRLQAHFLLMIGLIEMVRPTGLKLGSLAQHAANVERRGSAILHQLAPLIGRSPAELADALAAMGTVFAPVGIAAQDKESRIARLLARMEDVHAALSDWLRADPGNDVGGLGHAVARAMQVATEYGQAVLASIRATAVDPLKLLKRWLTASDEVVAIAGRVDWVLDGWDWICSLWLVAANDESRRMALLEMAQLVPVLPGETSSWTDTPTPPQVLQQPCRVTSREDAWRSGGTAFALIGRNETLRAMGA
jgi:hypothetical protein